MILGIDSSAISAGCALMDNDGRIIAEQFLNTKHTHSQTLLPMVESMLKCAGVKISDLDAAAVTVGPGSFTGLRIGVSTVKGMCYGAGKKCVGISSLEAIAYNFTGTDGTIVCCMDARCGQVYTALFQGKDGRLTRLSEDEALPLSELKEKLKSCTGPLWLCGDGAHLGLAAWGEELPVRMAPAHLCCQRASAVGLAAMQHLGEAVSPAALVPCYLRPANAMTLAERQHKTE